MSVNKVTITINSRQYTVVAEESKEYLEKLCAHINEKVESVLRGGQNIMGERPIVLAALNICDEYYKLLASGSNGGNRLIAAEDENRRLRQKIKELNRELDAAESGQISIDETAMKAEVDSVKNDLEDAENKIKFLENQIKALENKLSDEKKKYDEREKEFLDMIDKS